MPAFYNMRLLCYTETDDFTDFQGIGNDPIYKRFESVDGVVRNHVDRRYHSFLARPVYHDDRIDWWVDEWQEAPICMTDLSGGKLRRYRQIKEETISHYKYVLAKQKSDSYEILSAALKYIDDKTDDFFFCYDDKVVVVAWGMRLNTKKYEASGISAIKVMPNKCKITFEAGSNGRLKLELGHFINREKGTTLNAGDIPQIIADEGYEFAGWSPNPIGHTVTTDVTFTAQYKKKEIAPQETPPTPEPKAPVVKPPIKNKPSAKKLPWYKRLREWLTQRGCLKWLLWLLLIILIIAILVVFLKGCTGCASCGHHPKDVYGDPVLDSDTVVRVDTVRGPDGTVRDRNGEIRDIGGVDGTLPDGNVVAPIRSHDGNLPPLIHNDGAPDIVANRLLVFFEEEDADIDTWAREFKNLYPGDRYAVIGVDRNVPMIQIMIPDDERISIKESLTKQITSPSFFVVDESILQIKGEPSVITDESMRGWHLKATHVKEAWRITTGDPNIIVAIVDDGIDISHPMFTGRFYKAYNVFTQNRTLSSGSGHGTHVAGLAVGSSQYYEKGASGVAPACKLMPVQVFDNSVCPFSALASGIMYAIHNGANVVNISIAPALARMSQLSLEEQKRIAEQYYKDEERVYEHIFKVAREKNVILVFAAGNDDIMTAVLPECRSAASTVNVAAVTPQLKASSFTNYSIGTSISAPGVAIYSSFPRSSFKSMDGTSMASPIVTGAIALMKSIKPDITVGQAIGVMQKSGMLADNSIPPMILIDKALECIKNGDIPDGPVFNSSYGEKPDDAIGEDPKAALRQKLDELKRQRDEIDSQISEIEHQLNNK